MFKVKRENFQRLTEARKAFRALCQKVVKGQKNQLEMTEI